MAATLQMCLALLARRLVVLEDGAVFRQDIPYALRSKFLTFFSYDFDLELY